MTNVFISYSVKDAEIAHDLHQAIKNVGADVFLAEISIVPGADAHPVIFDNIRSSDWVFFIASKASCESSFVQQELGAAIGQVKKIVPILIDLSPLYLPGFMGRYQAIDLRKGTSHVQLHKAIETIGKQVQEGKFVAGVILGAIATALVLRL